MHSFGLLVGLALLCLALGEQYTDRYDNINIQEILDNKRLLDAYFKCMMDQGRCTPEGNTLKGHIKDAIQSSCSKCTPKQRKGTRQVVKHLRDNEKGYWEELKGKYDPGNEYKDKYEAFIAADD